jgi:hypothetical protein
MDFMQGVVQELGVDGIGLHDWLPIGRHILVLRTKNIGLLPLLSKIAATVLGS